MSEMKSTKLAVFGHYDSRGGTTGISIKDFTLESVFEAIREYNVAFGWEEEVEQYKKDPSRWAWDPTVPGSSPGEQDFMFVAELWYDDGDDIDGDLEDRGAVLIDKFTEPQFGVNDRGEFCGEQLELLIKLTLRRPVQLEFVPMEGGKYKEQERQGDPDDATWQKHVAELARHLRKGDWFKYGIEDRNWNDDAFGFIIGTGL